MTVTLREVAQRAGVSISTASRALTGQGRVSAETESRVVEAMQELDYRPWGRAMRKSPRSRVSAGRVAVVVRVARYKFSDPYWAPVQDGLDLGLRQQGFELSFTTSIEELDEERTTAQLHREFDGVVLLGDFADRLDLVDPRNTVVVEGEDELHWMGSPAVDIVTAEKRRSIYTLVNHVARCGRTRVGFIGPPATRDERGEAFLHALQRVGLPFDRDLYVQSPWTIEGSYEAAAAFLAKRPSVDALVCASDEVALGAMRAAREAGLHLPGDLAVTGFDDVPFAASLHPALTTVRLSRSAVGAVAAQAVIDRINDPDSPATIQLVPTTLVVRESCGERGASTDVT